MLLQQGEDLGLLLNEHASRVKALVATPKERQIVDMANATFSMHSP